MFWKIKYVNNYTMKSHLSNRVVMLFVAATLFNSCDSKQNTMEHDQHKENHNKQGHGHGFMDKLSVEKMAKSFESPGRDSMQKPAKILDYLGDIKDKTVIDIGAGTGYFSIKFADKGAHVIAADVSEEFQNFLRERIDKDKIDNIELRKTPYDSPLLKDREADLVFIANTYHHIENRTNYFAKVKKGLKAGGELIVVDYFNAELPSNITAPPMEMRVSIDQVVSELKKAGFVSFQAEIEMLPYQYILRAR